METKFVIYSPMPDFSEMLSNELEYMGFEPTHGEDFALALVDLDFCTDQIMNEIRRRKKTDEPLFVIGYSENVPAVSDACRKICDEILPRPFYMSHLRELVICHVSPSESEREHLPARIRRTRRLTLDEREHCVKLADRKFPLSANEFKVMKLLFSHAGEVVTKEEINALLGEKASNIGNVYICRLREKIDGALSQKHIITVRGVGYKLVL